MAMDSRDPRGERPEKHDDSVGDDTSPRPVGPEVSHWNRFLLDDFSIGSGDYWAELRVFLAVAKVKSFSKAADILNASTATVARRVRRLQDVLKVELFSVGTQGVQLTQSGVDLAVQLARIDGMLSDLERSVGELSDEPAGEVRVAITEGISTSMIVGPLQEFREAYPEVSVSLHAPRNINNLRDNGADMMIALQKDEEPGVSCRRLGSLHLIPMVSEAYVARYGEPTVETLDKHVFVNCAAYSAANAFWRSWSELIKNGRVASAAENSVTYFMMAKAGQGIALLSSFAVMEPSFRPVDLGVHIKIPLYGVALTDSIRRPAGHVAFNWLCEIYSEENPWFGEDLVLDPPSSKYEKTFRMIFNL